MTERVVQMTVRALQTTYPARRLTWAARRVCAGLLHFGTRLENFVVESFEDLKRPHAFLKTRAWTGRAASREGWRPRPKPLYRL